jgi:hypothetical protein
MDEKLDLDFPEKTPGFTAFRSGVILLAVVGFHGGASITMVTSAKLPTVKSSIQQPVEKRP